MRTAFSSAGKRLVRGSMSGGGVCLRRLRRALLDGVGLRRSRESRDWRVRPSTGVRTTLTASRCREDRCAAKVAAAVRSPKRILGLSPPSNSWSSLRRWAIRCGRCCGCRRVSTSWRGVARDGASGQRIHGSQAADELGFSRQSNRKADEGSQPSRPRRAVRAHQRVGRWRRRPPISRSSRSTPRRRS